MNKRTARQRVCDICGKPGARIRRVAETHGKGKGLLVIQNIPMVNCPHCGESYFTAETLREIDRLKRHRHELAVQRPAEVLALAVSRGRDITPGIQSPRTNSPQQ